MIKGIITALVTPFENNQVSDLNLEKLIQNQVNNSIDGIAFLGTTGEVLSLNSHEKEYILEKGLLYAGSSVHKMVGSSSIHIDDVIDWAVYCKKMGADSLLCLPPYYIKPNQIGLKSYYLNLCERSPLPIVLYNNPNRAGIELSIEIIDEIASHANCLGLKEANCDPDRIKSLKQIRDNNKENFTLLSGDDSYLINHKNKKMDGSISVISNLIPKALTKWIKGKVDEITPAIEGLNRALGMEGNPVAVKRALQLIGYHVGPCRLPLSSFNPSKESEFAQIIKKNFYQINEALEKDQKALV